MNSPAARSLVTYVFLVGLPLAGLLGVLRAGQGLHAPPPVDGTWRTVAAASGSGAALTPLVPPGANPAQLEVHQSGKYLSLDIGPLHLSGRLRGDSLVAHTEAPAAERRAAGCGHTEMELHASVNVAAEPDRLTLVLSEPGRPACPQVRWTAVHLAQNDGPGGKEAH